MAPPSTVERVQDRFGELFLSVDPEEIRLKMLDLFAGRGTASQPFRDRGWDVTTVDLDPRHRPDIVADLSAWMPPRSISSGHRHPVRYSRKHQVVAISGAKIDIESVGGPAIDLDIPDWPELENLTSSGQIQDPATRTGPTW